MGIVQPELTGRKRQVLWHEKFLCAVRKDHPHIGAQLTLDEYLVASHALISTRGTGHSLVDQVLSNIDQSRRIALSIQSFLAAPIVVASSNLVLTAPEGIIRHFAHHYELKVFSPPIDIPGFDVAQMWHERADRDDGHQWLRRSLAHLGRSQSLHWHKRDQ